jgi:ABC-type branched-subunit amino acid transport system substrate-binding protein
VPGVPRATPPGPTPPRPPAPAARTGTTARPSSLEVTGPIPRAAPQAAAPGGAPAQRPPPAPAEPPRRTPPARPPAPPRRRSAGLLVAAGAAALVLFGGIAWYVLAGGRTAEDEDAGPAAAVAAGPRGVLEDTIVLGMVASFTGSNKERGRAMRLGWETAIAEVNEAGGIHGRRLRLVAVDDGYDPARTAAAMKDVVEAQGAFAIVGNVGTATSAVAAPYAAEKDAVFFGALSGADLLRKTPPDRHVFNFRASLAAEAAAAVRYLVEVRRLPADRIAVLSQDDDFGRSGEKGALVRLEKYGVRRDDVLRLSYPRNTADLREAVAKLRERAADVQAVVMTATYKPAATFVRKTKDAKLDLFYTTVSADSNGLAEELVLSGEGYTDRVLLTQVVPVPSSGATTLIRYRRELEQRAPGEKPGSTSLEAWIGAQIFVEALKRAGRELDTAKLVAALESVQGWDLGIGGTITFGPADHQGSDMVFGWLLQPDGTYRQVDLE